MARKSRYQKLFEYMSERYPYLEIIEYTDYIERYGRIKNDSYINGFSWNNVVCVNNEKLANNTDKLYILIHEYVHFLLHYERRCDKSYLIVNEIEAEYTSREVMKKLKLKFNPTMVEGIDFLEYYNKSLENYGSRNTIYNTVRYDLCNRYIDYIYNVIKNL